MLRFGEPCYKLRKFFCRPMRVEGGAGTLTNEDGRVIARGSPVMGKTLNL